MDPLTHALLGAAAAHALLGRRFPAAWAVGGVAALAPDLDVLIRSPSDPLLAVEYHRHFTHALAFVPVGAAAAALPWLAFRRGRARWREVLAASLAGYATHGVLDACTTYGTRLLWPFSAERVAWSWISIIDPLFTLVLLLGLALAVRRGSRTPAAAALLLACGYLALGAVQRERALAAQARIAEARGHAPVRGEAFPTFANNLVWRSLYRAGDSLYVDRVRAGWGGGGVWTPGSAVAAVDEDDLRAEARRDPRALRDFRRFRHFSNGWVARAPADPGLIGDARYSLRTDSFDPVWGVRLSAGADTPTEWVNRSRERSLGLAELRAEVAGTDPRYRPLPRPVSGRGKPRSRRGAPSGPAPGRTPPARPGTGT